MTTPADRLKSHVKAFNTARPLFERISAILNENLRTLTKPLAPGCETTTRTKTVASFAEKFLRKKGKYQNPIVEMTDLSGARIVCAFDSHTQAIAEVLRQRFGEAIDEANSLDQRSKLRTGEFGYRALHYVIELGPGRELPSGEREVLWRGLTADMHGMKVEIQVRTRLQDVWSKMTHGIVYKGAQPLPESISREVARIAAEFESLDTNMERVIAQIAEYRTHFGPFLDNERLSEEKQFLAALREFDPSNPDAPLRQTELALARGDWNDAITHVTLFANSGSELTPALEAALGFALCQTCSRDIKDAVYTGGLRHLANATERNPRLLMAWLRRAECELSPGEALPCYQRAYRLDPSDPAALAGYVYGFMATTRDVSFVDLMRPVLQAGIDRCDRQAALKLDLPWAHFRGAYFRLLLADPSDESSDANRRNPSYESRLNASLKSFILGAATSHHTSPIKEILEKIEALRTAEPTRSDVAIASRLLALLLETRLGGTKLAARLTPHASPAPLAVRDRVLIVAGSAKLGAQEDLSTYRIILEDALRDFSGLVVSGGTENGVPGLVGQIARESGDRINAIGYIPDRMKSTSTAMRSRDYDDLRNTSGVHFSPLEPLQAWIDLIAAGVRPSEVTLLGLGGGAIAAFEYRLALVLGARVCIFSDSGREDEFLANDPDWRDLRWPLVRLHIREANADNLKAALFPLLPSTSPCRSPG